MKAESIDIGYYLLKLIRQQMTGEALPALRGDVGYAAIDSRIVTIPAETTFEQLLERRDWTWGEAGLRQSKVERAS